LTNTARIVIGFALLALGGYLLFAAACADAITLKSEMYSRKDSPFSFFLGCFIYLLAVLCGAGLCIQGWRD